MTNASALVIRNIYIVRIVRNDFLPDKAASARNIEKITTEIRIYKHKSDLEVKRFVAILEVLPKVLS